MYVCMYIYTHILIQYILHVCMYVYIYIYMYVSLSINIYIYIYTLCICIYIYIYIYVKMFSSRKQDARTVGRPGSGHPLFLLRWCYYTVLSK